MDWNATRGAAPLFPVIACPKNTLHKDMPALSAPYDWTIIDGPPLAHDVARSAIMSSDFVLLPMQPSAFDIWSAKKMVDLVVEGQAFRDLKYGLVVSRKAANTAISRNFRNSLLAAYPDSPVLTSEIGQRVAFVESAAQGLTVVETDPKGIAAVEIYSLLTELKEMIHGKVRPASRKAAKS